MSRAALDSRGGGHRRALSRPRTDEHREAPPDSAHAGRGIKRSAPGRWLLIALLLMALCIGMGVGVVLGARWGSTHSAASPLGECEAQLPHALATASSGTEPIRGEAARGDAGTPAGATRASDSAPCVRAPERRRAIATPSTPVLRTSRRNDSRPDAGAPAPRLSPDLHAALQLLRAAQQALRVVDGERALALLDEMARRTPEVLVEEREVTRVLAYCAADRLDSARATAAALRHSGGASVYSHRLSKSCVGPEPAPASLVEEMRRRARN